MKVRSIPTRSKMREQLVGPAAHAVDVVTEVRVGVEEDGAGRNLCEHAVRDVVQDLLGSLEWLHPSRA